MECNRCHTSYRPGRKTAILQYYHCGCSEDLVFCLECLALKRVGKLHKRRRYEFDLNQQSGRDQFNIHFVRFKHQGHSPNSNPPPDICSDSAQTDSEPIDLETGSIETEDFTARSTNSSTASTAVVSFTDIYVMPKDLRQLYYERLFLNKYDHQQTVRELIYVCNTRVTDQFCPKDVRHHLNDRVSRNFLNIALLALTSNVNQIGVLVQMARDLIPLLYKDAPCRTLIPMDHLTLSENVLSSRRKTSWKRLLPVPNLDETMESTHSYVRLRLLLEHTALTADEKGTVKPRHESLTDSCKFRTFQQSVMRDSGSSSDGRKRIIVVCLFWSDGFDPNLAKSNRGSSWAMTVTFLFYDCDRKEMYMVKTALSALGVDKKDHGPIFERLATDLSELYDHSKNGPKQPITTGSCFHKTEEQCDFYLLPFGCLMDNPERRSNFWLRGFNSINHLIFGICCHHAELAIPFETSTHCQCHKITEMYITKADWSKRNKPSCERCLSFSLERLLREGVYKKPIFVAPNGFETTEFPGHQLFRKPGPLSPKLLRDGWNFAFMACASGRLPLVEATKYLVSVLCLNERAISRFTEEVGARKEYILHLNNDPRTPQRVKEAFEEDPDKAKGYYESLGRANPLWDCFQDFEYVFETIMHNCMNFGKALRGILLEWASDYRFKSKVMSVMTAKLRQVQNLRVEDFKAREATSENFGGYVGENYRAFITLSPWFLQFLQSDEYAVQTPGECPPNGDISSWDKKHLLFHLHEKGVRKVQHKKKDGEEKAKIQSNSALLKSDLLALVRHVKELESGNSQGTAATYIQCGRKIFRPLFTRNSKLLHGKDIYDLFVFASRSFAILMDTQTKEEAARNRAEAHVAQLLAKMLDIMSCLTDSAEDKLRKKACAYGTIRTTSHLLSVSWLKAIHEGNDTGEGMVKHLRPFIRQGLRVGWHSSALTKFYREESMWLMLQYLVAETEKIPYDPVLSDRNVEYFERPRESPESKKVLASSRRFRRFKDRQSWLEWARNGECLSLVAYTDSGGKLKLGFVTAEDAGWYVNFIRCELKFSEGMAHFRLKTVESKKSICKCTMDVEDHTFHDFCIGLPHYMNSKSYAFIASNAAKLDSQSCFSVVA